MVRGKRTVRASEIGTFLYCRRAWWYQRQGVQPMNQDALDAGSDFHSDHVGQSRSAGLVALAAWAILVSALAYLVYLLISLLVG